MDIKINLNWQVRSGNESLVDPVLFDLFKTSAEGLTEAQRTHFLEVLDFQNRIAELLDNSLGVPIIEPEIDNLIEKAKNVFEEGYRLLSVTGVRDRHYKIIYDSLKTKVCPFCGYEPFDAPGLSREDEDHYLLRSIYPLAAANFVNLVPMGGRCNSRYKGTVDILYQQGGRRKAINPYGDFSASISLVNTNPFGNSKNEPDWEIDLVPDNEEVQTWENIFSIRKRLKESVLVPNYESTLAELSEWFEIKEKSIDSNDEQVLASINEFASYKKRHPDQGLGFLKDKIVEMIAYHYQAENQPLIALIRAGLQQPPEEMTC